MGYFIDVLVPETTQYFSEIIIPRIIEFIKVPIDNKEVLWALAPILVTLFLIQVYFGRHREEQIGWNTAYGNIVVLIFVVANLANYVNKRYGYQTILEVGTEGFYKAILILVVLALAVFLFFADFFHSMSRKISFFLSSSLFVTFIAYVSIVSVYSSILFDKETLVSLVVFFIFVWIFFKFFRDIIPPSPKAERFLERKEQEKKRKLLVFIWVITCFGMMRDKWNL